MDKNLSIPDVGDSNKEPQPSAMELPMVSPRPEEIPLAPSTASNFTITSRLTNVSAILGKVVKELMNVKDISKCRPQYEYCLKVLDKCLQQSTHSEKRTTQKCVNLSNQITNLRNRHQKAHDTIQNDRTKIVNLKGDVHSAKMDIICSQLKEKTAQERITTLKAEVNKLNKHIDEQDCNIFELEAKNEQHEKYKEATNTELLEAYRKSSGASYQVDKLQNDYAKVQDTLFGLRDELSRCKDFLAEESRTKDALKYELEKNNGGFKTEILDLTHKFNELKGKHKLLQETHDDTRYQLESMEAHNEVLQEFFETTQNKYLQEQDDTRSLTGDFDRKNQELQEVAEKLEFIQKEADQLKQLQTEVRSQVNELEREKQKFISHQSEMQDKITTLEVDNKECLRDAENAQSRCDRVISERDGIRLDLLTIRNKYYELNDERDLLKRENEVLEQVKSIGMSDAEQNATRLAVQAAEAAKLAAEAAKQAMEAAKVAREAEEKRRQRAEEHAEEMRRLELERMKRDAEMDKETMKKGNEQYLKDEEVLENLRKREELERLREGEEADKLRQELNDTLDEMRGGGNSVPSDNGLPDDTSSLGRRE